MSRPDPIDLSHGSKVSSSSVSFTLTSEQFDNRWSNFRKDLTKEEVISMFGKPSYADDKYIDYNGHLIGFFKDKVYFWDY